MKLKFTGNIQDTNVNSSNLFCVCPIFNQPSSKIINYMLNQKNNNWVLLLINNNSDEFVDDFNNAKTKYKNNKRIFFHQNNETLTKADCINFGREIFFNHTQFEYFTCLSDCNIYYQNFVGHVLNSFHFKKADFVYTNFYEHFPNQKFAIPNGSQYIDINDLLSNYKNNISSTIWKKDALKKIGTFNSSCIGCEILDYVIRSFQVLDLKRIHYCDAVTMTSRCKTHSKFPREIDNVKEFINTKIRLSNFPDTTIIINSYKPEKEDLITSITGCLKQIKVNVTVIVSTVENDPTIQFVNELNDSRVKLVISYLNEHPGKGPKGIFFQLNKAVKEVTTQYFSYFSSNDIIYPTKSHNEIKKIQENESIFCFSRFYSV